jgi:HSP20 family molecular chaperone IbpA
MTNINSLIKLNNSILSRSLIGDLVDYLDTPRESFNLSVFNNLNKINIKHWTEDDNNYYLEVEAPRFNKNEIRAEIKDGYLLIKGEHKTKNHTYSLNQSYSLPVDCLENKISVKLNNGILDVTIPKTEKAKPKYLEIKIE